ncbi:MAG: hypothetical protein ACI9JN_002546 [Bacteroidia bacterium]|jgi:hypothetical protein
MLVLWCSVQVADAIHHIEESHESSCDIGDTHMCHPHGELEICDLCTIVHGNAEFVTSFSSNTTLIASKTVGCRLISIEANATYRLNSTRGPPESV